MSKPQSGTEPAPLDRLVHPSTSRKLPTPHAGATPWPLLHPNGHGRWCPLRAPNKLDAGTETSPLKSSSTSIERRNDQRITTKNKIGTVESEGQKVHLCLDRHFISHLTLGLCAQPSGHSNCIAHLCQGHLNPLMELGGNIPHGSLSRVIHHK